MKRKDKSAVNELLGPWYDERQTMIRRRHLARMLDAVLFVQGHIPTADPDKCLRFLEAIERQEPHEMCRLPALRKQGSGRFGKRPGRGNFGSRLPGSPEAIKGRGGHGVRERDG